MLDITDYRTTDLATITGGHLFYMSYQSKPILALRVDAPGDYGLPAILLAAGQAPEYVAFQRSTHCLKVGKPVVRITEPAESFSLKDPGDAPGTLIVSSNGVTLMAKEGQANVVKVNLQNGAISDPRNGLWFVNNWQLGIENANGDFTVLYKWPPSASNGLQPD